MPSRERTTNVWPDEYESIVEFYFWEPQHLNRRSSGAGKSVSFDNVLQNLRCKEVPLNHLFSLFFSLAPTALTSRLISRLAPGLNGAGAELINSRSTLWATLKDICQPDLLFMTERSVVFFELKVQAETSIEQLMKYALAGYALSQDGQNPPALVLIGKTPEFTAAERFDELRQSATWEIEGRLARHASKINVSVEQLPSVARNLQLFRSDYGTIADFLRAELASNNHQDEGGETLRKLLAGMLDGFTRFNVVSGQL